MIALGTPWPALDDALRLKESHLGYGNAPTAVSAVVSGVVFRRYLSETMLRVADVQIRSRAPGTKSAVMNPDDSIHSSTARPAASYSAAVTTPSLKASPWYADVIERYCAAAASTLMELCPPQAVAAIDPINTKRIQLLLGN